jgi:hypothetical protein
LLMVILLQNFVTKLHIVDNKLIIFTANKRPMVTIVSPELLRDTTFSENPSTAVQCAIDDDNRIIVKTEIMDMEGECKFQRCYYY